MEFSVAKREFLRALSRTQGVADRKSSMPILSNVLVTAIGPGTIRLEATDLAIAVTGSVAAEVASGGSVAVAAKQLYEIVKSLPEGEILFAVGPNHRAEIKSGRSQFKIAGMPGDEFPSIPPSEGLEFFELPCALVLDLIAKTSFSMATDETRPNLAGALFEGDGKVLRMVTTDGHRLSKIERKVEEAGFYNFSMLVPAKGIAEIRRLCEDGSGNVSIAASTGNGFFRREGVAMSVKLVDAPFPPYAQVIPKSSERVLRAPRGVLMEAIKRVSLVAPEKTQGVKLGLSAGKLVLSSETPDVGEAHDEIAADYEGGDLSIGFNARYLIDLLGALADDEVRLELSGDLDPCVVRPVGETAFIGVVMPMRA